MGLERETRGSMGLLPEVRRAQNSASIVGWCVPKMFKSTHKLRNVTLSGNSVFADVTKRS